MSTKENNILGLKLPTDPRWVKIAEISLDEILNDHAFCEQKAATACISLIQSFPEKTEMVAELAPIVTEEWGHFRMVLHEMEKRKISLQAQRKDAYVNALLQHKLKGGKADERLVDQLLLCALIEARSCERFRLLHEELQDAYLKNFYYKFMVSEAGHYRLFIDLAKKYMPASLVEKRWQFWLNTEKTILKELPLRGDRMH